VSEPPERPSRYDRSFGGLVAALIATVLFVAAYVGVRALIRDQPDVEPAVDYLSCVAYLQQADVAVVHPAELPKGWRTNAIHFERGTPPAWRLGVVTDDDEFVGVVQQHEGLDDLLATYVDDAPVAGADVSPSNDLGIGTWQTWSDSGGDHAFSAEVTTGALAGETVLVYGSAPVADQESFLSSLTLAPVSTDVSAADCDTDEFS
jgi:hypothetical protein